MDWGLVSNKPPALSKRKKYKKGEDERSRGKQATRKKHSPVHNSPNKKFVPTPCQLLTVKGGGEGGEGNPCVKDESPEKHERGVIGCEEKPLLGGGQREGGNRSIREGTSEMFDLGEGKRTLKGGKLEGTKGDRFSLKKPGGEKVRR